MKYCLLTLIALCVLTTNAMASEQSVLARVTVYWKGESGARAAWNGARLRTGHCAVDPKRIPYGSRVVFPDLTCVAVDTGSDVVSRKAARVCARSAAQRAALVVDRYFDSKAEAMAWIARHPHYMTLRVLPRDSRVMASALNGKRATAGYLPPSTIPKYVARPASDQRSLLARAFSIVRQKAQHGFEMTPLVFGLLDS